MDTAAKKFYTKEEILNVIPISESGFYKAVREGTIASVSLGRRILVPRWWLDKFLADSEKPPQEDNSGE